MPHFSALFAVLLSRPAALIQLERLSPNLAIVLATAGCGLVFLELNRPGTILPGTLGLLLVLTGAASLQGHTLRPAALLLLGLSCTTLGWNLRRLLPLWLPAVATAGLVLALRLLIDPHELQAQVGTLPALLCGGTLGGSAAALSRIALRARRAKAVN